LSVRDRAKRLEDITKRLEQAKSRVITLESARDEVLSVGEAMDPSFEMEQIYCYIGSGKDFIIDTNGKGIPSKATIKAFCEFLMEHFG
jgi:hypothetical protein